MASFTDAIYQFNPYIQQLPVDAMMQVGMYKQAKYDEGLQKVQSYVDNIAGIDVIKPEHKQYLQSKINELGGKLRSVAAGDFSNQQLVNSVSGMASQIIKDPKVQSYAYSTQRVRKMLEEKDADIKAGKSNPDNVRVFENDLNSWLSDGSADSSFRGEYSQYYDVDKHVKEQFDAIKPGGWSIDQIYETDPETGKFVRDYVKDPKTGQATDQYTLRLSKSMKRLKNEGRLPSEVTATLNNIMSDGRVQKQLGISGRAQYLGVSGEQLSERMTSLKDGLLDDKYEQLHELGLKKSAGEDVQDKIDTLLTDIEGIDKKYSDLAKQAIENPEGLKASLFKEKAIANYAGMYGGVKTSTEYLDNPEWSNNWKMIVEANANKRHNQTIQTQLWIHEDTQKFTSEENKKNRENAVKLALLRKGGMVDMDGDGVAETFVPGGGDNDDPNKSIVGPLEKGDQPSAQSIINQVEEPYRKAADQFGKVSDEFTWTALYGQMPGEVKKLNDIVSKTGVSREEAMSILLNNAAKIAQKKTGISPDAYKANLLNKTIATVGNSDKLNPVMKNMLAKFQTAKTTFNNWNTLREGFREDTRKQIGADVFGLGNLGKLKPGKAVFEGKEYKIDPQDWYDLALYYKGHQSLDILPLPLDDGVKAAAIDAEKRIRAKGLAFMLDHVKDVNAVSEVASGRAITGLWRTGSGILKTLGSGVKQVFGGQAWRPDVEGMDNFSKAFDDINNETISKGYSNLAANIQRTLNIDPYYKRSVLTGKAPIDKRTVQNVSRFAMNYSDRNANLSEGFDGFKEALTDKNFLDDGGVLEAQYVPGTAGTDKPLVEIIAGNASGRKGSMIIAEDEATSMGIPVSGIYEPFQVKAAKSKINRRGATSNGAPLDAQTYYTGDTEYNKHDFVNNNGFGNVDVKANFVGQDGLYYGVYYVKTPGSDKPIIKVTNGFENLQQVMDAVKKTTPTEINTIISSK